jgi:thiamine-phosphate pyrophosphorylase
MRARLDLSVYVVLDPGMCAGPGLVETALRAQAGGATLFQLRAKGWETGATAEAARALKAALRAPLIVNDDADAALAAGADGLHVGQGDMPPAQARALIGPDMALGLSVETVTHARAVDPALVDHVGAGPVFGTATKPGHAAAVGFDGLAALVAAAPVPAVAIGGLKAVHAGAVRAAGAAGMAVVSAVCAADDPQAAAAQIAAAWRDV